MFVGSAMLFDPPSHEPLTERPWDAGRAQAAVAAIVADAEGAFDENDCGPRIRAT